MQCIAADKNVGAHDQCGSDMWLGASVMRCRRGMDMLHVSA